MTAAEIAAKAERTATNTLKFFNAGTSEVSADCRDSLFLSYAIFCEKSSQTEKEPLKAPQTGRKKAHPENGCAFSFWAEG